MTKKPKNHAAFELRFYDGYKGRETPRSVVIGNREFIIEKILERKRIHEPKSGKLIQVFVCETEGKKIRISVQESGGFEFTFL
jgi:hypothetical protein